MAEAQKPVRKNRSGKVRSLLAVSVAACLCLFVFYGRRIELSEHSKRGTARYVSLVPPMEADACLVYLTEEELFTEWKDLIVKGTVTKIESLCGGTGTQKV